MAESNLERLLAGGSIAMAKYLTAAPQQPRLTTAFQVDLRKLPHLTISAICADSSNPPQHHLLTLHLPKEVTVCQTIKQIIDEQTRIVSGEGVVHDLDPLNYILKVCCSQVGDTFLPQLPPPSNVCRNTSLNRTAP